MMVMEVALRAVAGSVIGLEFRPDSSMDPAFVHSIVKVTDLRLMSLFVHTLVSGVDLAVALRTVSVTVLDMVLGMLTGMPVAELLRVAVLLVSAEASPVLVVSAVAGALGRAFGWCLAGESCWAVPGVWSPVSCSAG